MPNVSSNGFVAVNVDGHSLGVTDNSGTLYAVYGAEGTKDIWGRVAIGQPFNAAPVLNGTRLANLEQGVVVNDNDTESTGLTYSDVGAENPSDFSDNQWLGVRVQCAGVEPVEINSVTLDAVCTPANVLDNTWVVAIDETRETREGHVYATNSQNGAVMDAVSQNIASDGLTFALGFIMYPGRTYRIMVGYSADEAPPLGTDFTNAISSAITGPVVGTFVQFTEGVRDNNLGQSGNTTNTFATKLFNIASIDFGYGDIYDLTLPNPADNDNEASGALCLGVTAVDGRSISIAVIPGDNTKVYYDGSVVADGTIGEIAWTGDIASHVVVETTTDGNYIVR